MDHSTSTATPTASKTIHLIRHGVARHNVPDAQTGERANLLDPKLTDPSLIRQGELQARVLGEQLRRRGQVVHSSVNGDVGTTHNDFCNTSTQQQPIELVVCSPLTRCLQTASLIFPSHFEQSTPAMMHNSTDYVLDRSCRVCCHGDVREAYGMHYPDKRSPLSQLKTNFPTVTYHPSLSEHDTDWQPNTRETRGDVARRIHNFFCWLIQQPHDNIAIVTHGVWMECALLHYCPEVLEFGKKRVYNCEVYCGKLGLENGDRLALKGVEQMTFYHA